MLILFVLFESCSYHNNKDFYYGRQYGGITVTIVLNLYLVKCTIKCIQHIYIDNHQLECIIYTKLNLYFNRSRNVYVKGHPQSEPP